jgi:hypothetical protein
MSRSDMEAVEKNIFYLNKWLNSDVMKSTSDDAAAAYYEAAEAAYYASEGGIVGFRTGAKAVYDASAKAAYEAGGDAPYNFIAYYYGFASSKAIDVSNFVGSKAYSIASKAAYAEAAAVKATYTKHNL